MSFMNPESYSLTEKSASEGIRISPRTLRRFRESALAPRHIVTPSRRVKFSMRDVQDWINRQINEGFMQDLRDGGVVSKQALHQGGKVTATDKVAENLASMNEKARLALVD